MSLVIAWIGIDTHGITSAYIASESRVSWNGKKYYDACKKVFHSSKYPEIVGYCGDVLFPSLVINAIMNSIDNGMLFGPTDGALKRYEKFKKLLFNEFHKYPKEYMCDSFELVYINKEVSRINYPSFHAYRIGWKKKTGFYSRRIVLPKESDVICVMGSGENEYRNNYANMQKGRNKHTSRNVYHCLNITLDTSKEVTIGGPPQLVGIYRKPESNAMAFGIIYNRKRYYNSLSVGKVRDIENVQWRNARFEICNGGSKIKKGNAHAQPIDIGLNLATPQASKEERVAVVSLEEVL